LAAKARRDAPIRVRNTTATPVTAVMIEFFCVSLQWGHMRSAFCIALVLIACSAFAQRSQRTQGSHPNKVWEPPDWNFPESVKASVSKEMFSAFHVAGYEVALEETSMKDAQTHLGGEIGQKGDAGDAVEWLCFHGADERGTWVLWLESGEIDGGYVGSFQWRRIVKGAVFDPRCRDLGHRESQIKLPLPLALGANKSEVLKALGEPSLKDDEQLIYLHEHDSTISSEPFTTSNIVIVRLENGIVWAIQVSKTSSS